MGWDPILVRLMVWMRKFRPAFVFLFGLLLLQVPSSVSQANTIQQPELQIAPELEAAERKRISVIKKASAATVCVFGKDGNGGGSGVVISPDGYALTNFHVVQGNGAFFKCSMPDGVLYDSVIVGIDPTGDVALIKLFGRDDFPSAVMGDSDQIKIGEFCFAVGNPFLLATDFQPSVSWGVVSGTHRYQYPAGTILEYADCIQTDAAINPGNSGGALFNSRGELIGVNGRGSFEKRGRVNVGVGYAISINQIKLFLDHLKGGRLVDHATLGATVATNDRNEVRISNILEQSDAFRRGLRFDDEVIQFGGRPITTVNQFKNVLGIFPKGWRVPLTYRRNQQTVEIMVRLTGVHADSQLADLIQGKPELPNIPIPPDGELPQENDQPQSTENAEAAGDVSAPSYDEFFVERRGYANYFFNTQSRDRVWESAQQHGDFRNVAQKWRLTSEVNQKPVTMILADEGSGLQGDDLVAVVDTEKMLAEQVSGDPTTGLLVGLQLWRRFLVKGPVEFGDVSYFGRLPVVMPREPSETSVVMRGFAETLVGLVDGIEVRYFFDADNHQLLAMELHTDKSRDPLELHFFDYQVHEDLTVPRKIIWVNEQGQSASIVLDQIEFLSNGVSKQEAGE